MASARRTTKVLRTPRDRTVAYARKQKPTADGGTGGEAAASGDDGPAAASATDDTPADAARAVTPADAARAVTPADAARAVTPTEVAPSDPAEPAAAIAAAMTDATEAPPAAAVEATSAMTVEPPEPSVEPWPDGTPVPQTPVDPARARTHTVTMPIQASIGTPPAMPDDPAAIPAPVNAGQIEHPTVMPGPREIPGGNPDDPASPPGYVPSGDSRSMRRRTDRYEFALIYRIQTYVISRFGVVGTRGQWRVVEYPTPASASHAYAKECSRFVSEGFSDYRE